MKRATRSRTVKRSVAATLSIAALGVVAVGTRTTLDHLQDEATVAVEESETNLSTVEVKDLTETLSASGTLQYNEPIGVTSPVAGIVLEVVDVGASLKNGDTVAIVDDHAMVWLDGSIPAWRTMSQGDEGADVLQLEESLTALGFNGDNDVSVDEEYTAATAAMVKDWQSSLGVDATGQVELGHVVFAGSRTRVASVAVSVGESVEDGAELFALGTNTRYAILDATPSDAITLQIGDPAAIELPDQSEIGGTVAAIETGSDAWQITVTFGDNIEYPSTDVTNVEMSWTNDIANGVLTIPSSSLLRLDSGAYVVDVVGADGVTTPTPVSIGVMVGTRVEITGGLTSGATVISL